MLIVTLYLVIVILFVLKIWLLFCVCRFKERKWDTRRILTSGGMPSSHSATVTSLAACIGLQEGVGSSSFAIAVVLACVLPPEHPLSNVRPLRDSLGHTPFQV
ncbi:hypothetical protein HanPI659440_Chr05g0215491 [Helianthus annuus]|nr:hypothetical protein HanPI659440_Chr05g0215491 [Helianthus annuus]